MCKKFEHVTPLDYWTYCAGLDHFQDKDLPPILRMHGVDDDSIEGCARCIMILLRQAIVNSVERQTKSGNDSSQERTE